MNTLIPLFKGLADGTRLNILEQLLDGEKCVCELIPATGRSQSTVSAQLAKLESGGVVTSRKEGKKVIYRISDYRVCEILRTFDKLKGDKLTNCCGVMNCDTKEIKVIQ